MEFNIDEIKLTSKSVYIKGWVHAQKYKAYLSINDNEKEIINNKYSRYDLCPVFKEKIDDNEYGFKIDKEYKEHIKKVVLIIEIKGKETIIINERVGKIIDLKKKIKSRIARYKRAIKFLWREYHFIIPPIMIKKYIKDHFDNKKNVTANYNPEIMDDYNNWLNKQVYEGEKINYIDYVSLNKDDSINFDKKIYSLKDLKKIKGKYVCLFTGKVEFHDCFEWYVKNKIESEKCDIIYFDSDKIEGKNKYSSPMLKPDFSYDTLLGYNYIGNVIVIKKDLLSEKIKTILEIILKNKDKNIEHISKVLYHTDYQYSQDDSYKDINNHLKELKKEFSVEKSVNKVTNVVTYDTKNNPLVSIIIPTKDYADVLKVCVDSIYRLSTYKNFEVIIMDNNSEKKETFELFDELKKEHKNLFVNRIECKFNYSYINNVGIKKYSKGEYILLLNNDTEVVTPNWIELMLGYAMQDHVGTVGAKLLFKNSTIQHAGVIIGKGGIAGHANQQKKRYELAYNYSMEIPYDYSANTAACMMVSRKKYDMVKGLEEKLEVTFNDVDFNLKLLDKGLYNVMIPQVELFHYESLSRGLETTPEKQKRFISECELFKEKWSNYLEHDPFYNDNFDRNNDYLLK